MEGNNSYNESCDGPTNNSCFLDEPPEVLQFGFWIQIITTPIIALIGCVGNTLSFIVMKSKTLRKKSYSHYLCSLAVFDTLVLCFKQVECVDRYMVKMKNIGLFDNFNSFGCKAYNFMSHVVCLMSSWLVVLMAIERLVAVCVPFKKPVIRQQSGAAAAICVALTIVCLSQSFRLVIIDHVMFQGFHDCLARTEYISLYTSLDVYFYQWTCIFCIPVTLIIGCNGMVLYRVFQMRQEVTKTNHSKRFGRSLDKKHRSTWMLLIVSFTYIITLLPLFTLSFVIDMTIKFSDKDTAKNVFASLMPYIEVCSAISLLNYAINSYIYVLSGRRFRYELTGCIRHRHYKMPKRSFTARSTREELIRLGRGFGKQSSSISDPQS